jgi:hypothetical protein
VARLQDDALAAALGSDRIVVTKAETGSARLLMTCWPRSARRASWTLSCSPASRGWPAAPTARRPPGSRTGWKQKAEPSR